MVIGTSTGLWKILWENIKTLTKESLGYHEETQCKLQSDEHLELSDWRKVV